MSKARLEAFSDGVLAIIITIMVLELKAPHGSDLMALRPLLPIFLSYLLSFALVGIYWNNHHHLLHAAKHVTAGIMWANLHLLFWLSLVPFVTAWFGETHGGAWPTALYGVIFLMAGFAYNLLQTAILSHHPADAPIAVAFRGNIKGKLSLGAYLLAIPLAFVRQWLAYGLYVFVALMWIVPDRRIASTIEKHS